MVWGSENNAKRPTATERIRWAENNYAKHSLQEKEEKRLALLVNLMTLDVMIEKEGGSPLLSEEMMDAWLSMYQEYRPSLPRGRPKHSSSETGPIPES